MDIGILQIILILIYMAFYTYTQMNVQISLYGGSVVIGGFITGLILGNPTLGLTIGSTLQLMSLGIGAYGGASVPDYHTGAVIGTIVAIATGTDIEYGLAIALPVSLLMIQVDVLVRMATTFFVHESRKSVEKGKYQLGMNWILAGIIPWMVKAVLPILLVFVFGIGAIESILAMLPDWLMGTFKVAGGLLPAVGIAILLKYMNPRNYLAYLIFGFAIISYLKIPMLGVAIFGLVLALIMFAQDKNKSSDAQVVQTGGSMDDEL
ncbi:PTS sugar transporter subunit IIC [Erysipelothrix sp. HDW6C]|uniref:PTS mannose/fructose/sorbose/N-acetylgalactosamine transporter subunit IIC n=1 Tax=Erysipelothrix sp. HDW6C TaxID=2714930 RepID=UPI00140D5C32|nr:PTS sugar transporter subunit IIC [Erysipelothrix sp. HDW6C]QIK70680.1 PTS sugar transporter subunit IIC [Erysipelothrix sp. HDW6C]